MNLLQPKGPGIYVNPVPSGAEVEIRDVAGRSIKGKLDNDALRQFGERCIAVANRERANAIFIPGG